MATAPDQDARKLAKEIIRLIKQYARDEARDVVSQEFEKRRKRIEAWRS